MTKETLIKNVFQWGVLTAIVAVAFPDLAFAEAGPESGIGHSLYNFINELFSIPSLVSLIAFAIGAALCVVGALRLKAHTENPAQNKFAPGIGYLLAGGGLAALTFLVQTVLDTLHLGSTAAGYIDMPDLTTATGI